jgi:hypothetical protein
MKSIMKNLRSFLLATMLAGSVEAQELLPPDFVLFGRTSSEYIADYLQYMLPLSTNGDYLLPNAGTLANDPVYFLQRPLFGTPPPGVQTYFIPDEVYVCFPIVFFWADNVDTIPAFTVEQLRDGLRSIVSTITNVHATIDGVAFTNLASYRVESPVFSVLFPSSDNFYSVILGHPLEGIVDRVIASGYLLMLKPLAAGLHDFRIGATIGGANNFSFERHFQINSLTLPQFLARETDKVAGLLGSSSLQQNQQRSLLASLNAAKASFESENLRAGINQLRAFQNKVQAQVAQNNPTLAEQLSSSAEQLIDRANPKLLP